MRKLHAANAARRGYTHVMVCSVDTDVVAIAVAKFQYIFLSHDMFRSIGEEKSQDLLTFYAFAGCDQHRTMAKMQHGKGGAQWMM